MEHALKNRIELFLTFPTLQFSSVWDFSFTVVLKAKTPESKKKSSNLLQLWRQWEVKKVKQREWVKVFEA